MHILEQTWCEGGPPATEAWEMIIAEARKYVTQTRSQTGETQTGVLVPTDVHSNSFILQYILFSALTHAL